MQLPAADRPLLAARTGDIAAGLAGHRRTSWLVPLDMLRLVFAVLLTIPTLLIMRGLGYWDASATGRTGPRLRRLVPRRVGLVIGALAPVGALLYPWVAHGGHLGVAAWVVLEVLLLEISTMAIKREAWIAAFEPQWLRLDARPLGGQPRRPSDRRLQHLLRVHVMFGVPLLFAAALTPVGVNAQTGLVALGLLRYAAYAGDDFEAFCHWDMHCDVLDVGERWRTAAWRASMDCLLGPLVGYVPLLYRTEHLLIHHWRNSGPEDIHSTTPYRRTSLLEFCLFALSVCFSVTFGADLIFHRRCRGRRRVSLLSGLVGYWTVTALLLADGRLLGTYLVLLALIHGVSLARFQYVWHGLIPPDDPTRLLTSTVLWVAGPSAWAEVRSNQTAADGASVTADSVVPTPGTDWGFYDNLHLLHHLRPRAHFTQYPELLRQMAPDIAQANSVVLDLDGMRSFPAACWAGDLVGLEKMLLTEMPDAEKGPFLRHRLEPVADSRQPLAYLCEKSSLRTVDRWLGSALRAVL